MKGLEKYSQKKGFQVVQKPEKLCYNYVKQKQNRLGERRDGHAVRVVFQ